MHFVDESVCIDMRYQRDSGALMFISDEHDGDSDEILHVLSSCSNCNVLTLTSVIKSEAWLSQFAAKSNLCMHD